MPFFTEVSLSSNASGTAGQCMAPLLECPLLALSGHHAPKHKTSAMRRKADISRSQQRVR